MQSIWSCRRRIGFRAASFLRSCRGTRRTRTLRSSLLRCGERPGGHPDVAFGRCGADPQSQLTYPAKPAKGWMGDSPLPLPVRYAGIAHTSPALTEPRVSVHLRGGGVVPSVVTSGCPKRSEGGSPAGTRRAPSLLNQNQRLNTKPLSRKAKGFSFVRDTGIEPVTSSVSGKRATAAPIALTKQLFCCEVRTGFEPAYTALQAAA